MKVYMNTIGTYEDVVLCRVENDFFVYVSQSLSPALCPSRDPDHAHDLGLSSHHAPSSLHVFR